MSDESVPFGPPTYSDGWVPFGTHAYCGVRMEFNGTDDDGLPTLERLVFVDDMPVNDDVIRLTAQVEALSARLRAVHDFAHGEPTTHGARQTEGYRQALSDLLDLLEQGDNQ